MESSRPFGRKKYPGGSEPYTKPSFQYRCRHRPTFQNTQNPGRSRCVMVFFSYRVMGSAKSSFPGWTSNRFWSERGSSLIGHDTQYRKNPENRSKLRFSGRRKECRSEEHTSELQSRGHLVC